MILQNTINVCSQSFIIHLHLILEKWFHLELQAIDIPLHLIFSNFVFLFKLGQKNAKLFICNSLWLRLHTRTNWFLKVFFLILLHQNIELRWVWIVKDTIFRDAVKLFQVALFLTTIKFQASRVFVGYIFKRRYIWLSSCLLKRIFHL